MQIFSLRNILLTTATTGVLAAWPAAAGIDRSQLDELWSNAVLTGNHKAGEYPAVKLRGRYQGQMYTVDADADGDGDGTQTRRLRLGLDTRFSSNLRFSFDLNLNADGGEPFVKDFDYARLDYKINSDTSVSIGKLRRNPLTLEDSTSSNKIVTIERSLAANTVSIGNSGGVYVKHKHDGLNLGGGVLMGGLDDELALPDGDGGFGYQFNVGGALTDATSLRFDYFYNDGDDGNDAFNNYRHTVSLNSTSSWGALGLQTDLIFADAPSAGRGDVSGLVVLPTLDLTPAIKLVARYTYLSSNGDSGIRLGSRYERAVDSLAGDRGDEYQALYAGANYYIYGDKLKFMFGAELAKLNRPGAADFESLTATGAIRFYF